MISKQNHNIDLQAEGLPSLERLRRLVSRHSPRPKLRTIRQVFTSLNTNPFQYYSNKTREPSVNRINKDVWQAKGRHRRRDWRDWQFHCKYSSLLAREIRTFFALWCTAWEPAS